MTIYQPSRLRALWLRRHRRHHPDHVLIGWSGAPLQCGTCLGIPEPQLSNGAFSYAHRLPRHFVRITRDGQ